MEGSGDSASPPSAADRFAPLKRNHACLQCKRRKVKCDAAKPTCSPCMRSHGHAARAAHRNKTTPPVLTCTYAEVDSGFPSDDDSPEEEDVDISAKTNPTKRKKTTKRDSGAAHHTDKNGHREEERDQLLARIAELEQRINGLTPSDTASSERRPASRPSTINLSKPPTPMVASQNLDNYTTNWAQQTQPPIVQDSINNSSNNSWSQNDTNNFNSHQATVTNEAMNWDFGGLFLVPMNWPLGLPSPFLLDHLIETFFNHTPQFPRIINRAALMTRVRLPPTSSEFPHPALLHAISAIAATHTAWVNSVPPEAIEDVIERHKKMNLPMENIEDFALAQGELAQKAIKNSTQICAMGSGTQIFEMAQASILLAEVYMNKGLPMQGWMSAASGPRLLQALEVMNRNVINRGKDPLLSPAQNATERDERNATVWQAFIVDSGFSVNSFWLSSLQSENIFNPFPVSADQFNSKEDQYPDNPQTALSKDMLTRHPVEDAFVMASKAATLVFRCAKWTHQWGQREMKPNDDLEGLNRPDFQELVNDIHLFQANLPAKFKNVYKLLESPINQGLDANIISMHIMPNVALALLYESFVDWTSPNVFCLSQLQKCFEAILGIAYQIPSNMDITRVLTSLSAFSLYTTGRMVANFIHYAMQKEQYGLALRFRADMQSIQGLLNRYGQKHTLGQMTSKFLSVYLVTPTFNATMCGPALIDAYNEINPGAPISLTKLNNIKGLPPQPGPTLSQTPPTVNLLGTNPSTIQSDFNVEYSGGARLASIHTSSSGSGPTPPGFNTVTPPDGATLYDAPPSAANSEGDPFSFINSISFDSPQGPTYQSPTTMTNNNNNNNANTNNFNSNSNNHNFQIEGMGATSMSPGTAEFFASFQAGVNGIPNPTPNPDMVSKAGRGVAYHIPDTASGMKFAFGTVPDSWANRNE